jgi:hypothetical protein
MGAIFYPNCPRCGKLGVGECKSCIDGAYEVFSCLHCGFGFDWKKRVDEEKSTPENPIYTETMELNKSNFSLGIKYKDGFWQGFSFVRGVSEEEAIEAFKEIIASPEVDAGGCYLSKWDVDKKEVVYLYNTPNSYERLEEERTPEEARRYANFEEIFHTKID